MNRLYILSLLAIVLISFNLVSSWKCDSFPGLDLIGDITIKCNGDGGSCGIDFENGVITSCEANFLCNNQTMKCEPKASYGEVCTDDQECESGWECVSGKCGATNYLQLGEKCSNDDECSKQLVCSTGICKVNTTICTGDDDCAFNQYCNTTQGCLSRIADAQPCQYQNLDAVPCGRYSSCVLGVTGSDSSAYCAPTFSVQENKPCDEDENCDISKGLQCFDNTCQLLKNHGYNQTQFSGNCNNPDLELDPCNEGSSCTCITSGDGFCLSTTPTSIDEIVKCGGYSKEMMECLVQYECNSVQMAPTSCAMQNCGEIFCSSVSACAPMLTELGSLQCFFEASLPFPCVTLGYSINAAGSSLSLISISPILIAIISTFLMM